MKGTHEEPEEEEEGEQAAAQMEGQAEHLPGESRPHCADDGIPRIDRPAEGNNAHGGASHGSFEVEEQPRTTIQSIAGPSRAPNQQEHTPQQGPRRAASSPALYPPTSTAEESPSKEVAPGQL
jgi:hypothetical protein